MSFWKGDNHFFIQNHHFDLSQGNSRICSVKNKPELGNGINGLINEPNKGG